MAPTSRPASATQAPHPAPDAAQPVLSPARRWQIFAAVAAGVFMSTLDNSIVNVALPVIAGDFGVLVDRLQWVVIGYTLTLTGLMPAAGRAGDLLGRGRLFSLGFLGFAAGSLLCSLAWSAASLIIFRIAQGLGAVLVMSNTMAIVTMTFPRQERGRALGLMGSFVALGSLTGPAVGGLLTAGLGWRSVFYVTVPVGILGFLASSLVLPKDRGGGDGKFDLAGLFLWLGAATALLLGLGRIARSLDAPLVAAWPVVPGLVFLALLVWRQLRVRHPLLSPVIFRSPGVSPGFLAGLLSFTAGYIAVFLTPFVAVNSLGFGPRITGLIMTATPAAMMLVAPLSGWGSDRFGPRTFTLAGLASIATGMLLLAQVDAGMGPLEVAWRLAFLGAGWGLFNSPNSSTIMAAVPAQYTGTTGSLAATVRNFAFSLGAALAAVLFMWGSGGATGSAAYVEGFSLAMKASALIALTGMVPAALRHVPPRAGAPGKPAA